MGRMHAPGKGLSLPALPYCHRVPTWLKLTSDDVKEQIYELAKKGLTPSQTRECISFPFPASRSFLNFLAHGPFTFQVSSAAFSNLSLSLALLLLSCLLYCHDSDSPVSPFAF
uniref:Small ribosomal subunit protein uS15 N-terminal domain-containing protein n=1 Tax=Suricata suricatta TaxID=37032 RepID=A0A673T119_SURSU